MKIAKLAVVILIIIVFPLLGFAQGPPPPVPPPPPPGLPIDNFAFVIAIAAIIYGSLKIVKGSSS
ncbi:hypothetical protein [uncultured Polaribacter sp.]|uniref:hypothetical protein n=1 Tax=uncultured Polaribacter sp. TaxID=174711 RepID=UPI0026267DAA|nr:hypothetical protein [uncultured Polaribacter sp.]